MTDPTPIAVDKPKLRTMYAVYKFGRMVGCYHYKKEAKQNFHVLHGTDDVSIRKIKVSL